MKSHTDLSQSKKLAEILPLESADMYYDRGGLPSLIDKYVTHESIKNDKYHHLIPCWSLAALIDALPNGNMLVKTTDGKYYCIVEDIMTKHYDNPLDACYKTILELKK
jgi:hypothetical protein